MCEIKTLPRWKCIACSLREILLTGSGEVAENLARRGLYQAARETDPEAIRLPDDLHSLQLYSSETGTSLSSGSGQLAMDEQAESRESRSQGHHSRQRRPAQ